MWLERGRQETHAKTLWPSILKQSTSKTKKQMEGYTY
jgi:hypothetical protein